MLKHVQQKVKASQEILAEWKSKGHSQAQIDVCVICVFPSRLFFAQSKEMLFQCYWEITLDVTSLFYIDWIGFSHLVDC